MPAFEVGVNGQEIASRDSKLSKAKAFAEHVWRQGNCKGFFAGPGTAAECGAAGDSGKVNPHLGVSPSMYVRGYRRRPCSCYSTKGGKRL